MTMTTDDFLSIKNYDFILNFLEIVDDYITDKIRKIEKKSDYESIKKAIETHLKPASILDIKVDTKNTLTCNLEVLKNGQNTKFKILISKSKFKNPSNDLAFTNNVFFSNTSLFVRDVYKHLISTSKNAYISIKEIDE